jgi:hypothetical protein
MEGSVHYNQLCLPKEPKMKMKPKLGEVVKLGDMFYIVDDYIDQSLWANEEYDCVWAHLMRCSKRSICNLKFKELEYPSSDDQELIAMYLLASIGD